MLVVSGEFSGSGALVMIVFRAGRSGASASTLRTCSAPLVATTFAPESRMTWRVSSTPLVVYSGTTIAPNPCAASGNGLIPDSDPAKKDQYMEVVAKLKTGIATADRGAAMQIALDAADTIVAISEE